LDQRLVLVAEGCRDERLGDHGAVVESRRRVGLRTLNRSARQALKFMNKGGPLSRGRTYGDLAMTGLRFFGIAALAGAALSVLPVAANAQPARASSNQCFLTRNIDGFNAPDSHTVYVRVGVNQFYRLDLMTDCLELPFRLSIGLETTPGEAWVCSPLDATVIYHTGGIPQRCPVKAIHKLTPEELAALPKRDRP
jgi:hypothetical protein